MKSRGIIRGTTIELEQPIELPEGTRVQLDVKPAAESREIIEKLKALRAKQLERWGKPLNLSVQLIREHRDR